MSETSPLENVQIRMITTGGTSPKAVRLYDLSELAAWDGFAHCRLTLESVVSCALGAKSDIHDEAVNCLAGLDDKSLLQAVILHNAQYSETRRGAAHLLLDNLCPDLELTKLGVWAGIRKGKPYTWQDILKALKVKGWQAAPPATEPYLFEACSRVMENPLPEEVPEIVSRLTEGLGPDTKGSPSLRRLIVLESWKPEIMSVVGGAFPAFAEQVAAVLTSPERPWPKHVNDERGYQWMFDLAKVAGRHLAETADPTRWTNLLVEAADLPWLWMIIHDLVNISCAGAGSLATIVQGWMNSTGYRRWEKKGYPKLPEKYDQLVRDNLASNDVLLRLNPEAAVALLKLLAVEESPNFGRSWQPNTECVKALMARDPEYYRRELRATVREGERTNDEFVQLWYQATGRDEQTPEDLAAWVASQGNSHKLKSSLSRELLPILLQEGIAGTDLIDEGRFFGNSSDVLAESGYELKPLDVSSEERVRRLIPHHRNGEVHHSPIWDNAQWREAILRSGFCADMAVASLLLRAVGRTGAKYGLLEAARKEATDWLTEVLIPECISDSLQNALWNLAWNPSEHSEPGNHPTFKDAEEIARRLLAHNCELAWIRSADRNVLNAYLKANWWPMIYCESKVVQAFLDPEDQVSLLLDNVLRDEGDLPWIYHFGWLFATPESKARLERFLLKNSGRITSGIWLKWVRTHGLIESGKIKGRVRELLGDSDPDIQELALAVLTGEPEKEDKE